MIDVIVVKAPLVVVSEAGITIAKLFHMNDTSNLVAH